MTGIDLHYLAVVEQVVVVGYRFCNTKLIDNYIYLYTLTLPYQVDPFRHSMICILRSPLTFITCIRSSDM